MIIRYSVYSIIKICMMTPHFLSIFRLYICISFILQSVKNTAMLGLKWLDCLQDHGSEMSNIQISSRLFLSNNLPPGCRNIDSNLSGVYIPSEGIPYPPYPHTLSQMYTPKGNVSIDNNAQE